MRGPPWQNQLPCNEHNSTPCQVTVAGLTRAPSSETNPTGTGVTTLGDAPCVGAPYVPYHALTELTQSVQILCFCESVARGVFLGGGKQDVIPQSVTHYEAGLALTTSQTSLQPNILHVHLPRETKVPDLTQAMKPNVTVPRMLAADSTYVEGRCHGRLPPPR